MNTLHRPLNQAQTFAALPPIWAQPLMPLIRQQLAARREKTIILDDDPTGTQTAADTTVLTDWSLELVRAELDDPSPAVYILTNTRAMSPEQAKRVNHEIVVNVREAARNVDRPFSLISRGDSTLRGHFPLETDTLADALATLIDAVLLVPAFMAGGRFTLNGVHYVQEGEWLMPAGSTPFAADPAFGYRASALPDWVEEKTGGAVRSGDVWIITLEQIRQHGVEGVRQLLMRAANRRMIACDAVTERDLEVLALAALQAESAGKRLIYRTAASFAAIRAGITPPQPISAAALKGSSGRGGLIVVGSYVPKTTLQLKHLLTTSTLSQYEVEVSALLNVQRRTGVIDGAIEAARRAIKGGQTIVLFTSRQLYIEKDGMNSLRDSASISEGLVEIVANIGTVPSFIIAKGGITSSDLATNALHVKRARVIGQIIPGVPVWRLGEESAFPGLLYVVFPGNVGGDDALSVALTRLVSQE
jgi:uncharacterized protein YgbK (DUF1537 family)